MIRTEVLGASEAIASIDSVPDRVRKGLFRGISRLTIKLQRMVMRDKLSGQVLKVRTGRLRRSIGQVVETNGDKIAGIVSTPVVYAPPHEYGFKGTVDVRSHVRQIKQAFGKPISAKSITVQSYSRKMNLPERSFLRSAFKDLQASGAIDMEINAAISEALK